MGDEIFFRFLVDIDLKHSLYDICYEMRYEIVRLMTRGIQL